MGKGSIRNNPCPCGSGQKYKHCCKNRLNRKPSETIEHFLGEKWINKEVSNVKIKGYKNLNPMNLNKIKLHPVIKSIANIQIKRQKYKGQEYYPLGKSENFQRLLHKNLTDLEPDLNLEHTRERLRSEFRKIEYELMIIGAYKRLGYSVNFLHDTEEKAPECEISCPAGNVFIECKRKDLLSSSEQKVSNWWEEFQHLMTKELKSINEQVGVRIKIPKNPSKEDNEDVISEIKELIKNNRFKKDISLDKNYEVNLEKFGDINSSVDSQKIHNFTEGCDASVIRQFVDKNNVGKLLKNKKGVESSKSYVVGAIFPNIDESKKIQEVLSSIKKAYAQLVEGESNIVYVDLRMPNYLFDFAGDLMNKIEQKLLKKFENHYSKISAVVLTNIKNTEPSYDVLEKIIFNNKAVKPTPKKFKVIGDYKDGKSIINDIKSVLK